MQRVDEVCMQFKQIIISYQSVMEFSFYYKYSVFFTFQTVYSIVYTVYTVYSIVYTVYTVYTVYSIVYYFILRIDVQEFSWISELLKVLFRSVVCQMH